MNVLVVAPHPDDESLGCGGALCLHHKRGDRITAVFLTSGELSIKDLPPETVWQIREQEAQYAAKVLGLAETKFLRFPDWYLNDHTLDASDKMASILAREKPDLIYLPHDREWHPDHKAAVPIIRRALRQVSVGKPILRAFEVWTPLTEYTHVEDITEVMPLKLRAICLHLSQLKDFAYDQAIQGLNRYRGCFAAKCRYAEVFQDIPMES
jgi:N-acetylglucosamine malate deacetylase 1